MKKIRRLPTFLGLVLVVAGVIAGTFAVQQNFDLFIRANPQITPRQVKITNITDQSFTVSWITDEKTIGIIKYGPDQSLSFTVGDDRDQATETDQARITHHATINSLEPTTNYFFEISSDNKYFKNNDHSYQVTTAQTSQAQPPPSDIVYGSVLDINNKPAPGAIVYLTLANTISQSALSKESGNWTISLNLARAADLTNYANYHPDSAIEEIFVQAGEKGTATAITTTQNDNPVPAINLGQTHDFRGNIADTQASPDTPPDSADAVSRFEFENMPSPPSPETVTIINPDDGESVATTKPAFLGKAPSGQELLIVVESPEPQEGIITTSNNGEWAWTPSSSLDPGEHTVTASYTDSLGNLHEDTLSFIVLAEATDDWPSIESTPSATITPTVSPAITPTATPTITPTATPTIGRAAQPSTQAAEIDEPGYWTPTLIAVTMGIALIGFGLLLAI